MKEKLKPKESMNTRYVTSRKLLSEVARAAAIKGKKGIGTRSRNVRGNESAHTVCRGHGNLRVKSHGAAAIGW